MRNKIRQYTEWEEAGDQLVSVRQFTMQDEALYDTQSNPYPENQAQIGTWVVDAKYDNGLSSVIINLEDIIRQAFEHNPSMVADIIRDVNARKALGDTPGMDS